MLSYKELEEIAIRYCQEGTPLSKLAEECEMSKTTLVRYMNGKRTVKLFPQLQEKVNERLDANKFGQSKATYGNQGKTSLKREDIISLATEMVENGLTLEDLLTEDGPTKATIYNLFNEENLGNELYQKVVNQYKINIENSKFKKGN